MANFPFTIDDKFLSDARVKALRYAQRHYSAWATVSECEDLVQDALMTIYRRVHEGTLTELTSSLSTMVIGFVKNIAKNRQSEQPMMIKTMPSEQSEEDVLEPIDIAIIQESMKKWKDDDSHGQHMQKAVYEVVNDLAEPCRTILWSFYWEGKSMVEIADEMNYSGKDVAKSQKSRCMTKVKQAMDDIIKRMRL